MIACAPGRLALLVIHQRFCWARELARYPTAAAYYWCQLSGSLNWYSKSESVDGEHLFLLQKPSRLSLSQTKGPLSICSMGESQAVSKGEKDFLSGTMSTASQADKIVVGFLFLKRLLDEAWKSSSPHNKKRWKFGISYQQVKTAFFFPSTFLLLL